MLREINQCKRVQPDGLVYALNIAAVKAIRVIIVIWFKTIGDCLPHDKGGNSDAFPWHTFGVQ
jgi:hypothetical protein